MDFRPAIWKSSVGEGSWGTCNYHCQFTNEGVETVRFIYGLIIHVWTFLQNTSNVRSIYGIASRSIGNDGSSISGFPSIQNGWVPVFPASQVIKTDRSSLFQGSQVIKMHFCSISRFTEIQPEETSIITALILPQHE